MTHAIQITPRPAAPVAGFNLGTPTSPKGPTITADNQCLLRDGKPWLGVMGEIHYSRVPAADWREELLKMKAGGIDVIATYIFWIHHEEIEGQFDWTGDRDLRKFLETCQSVGLPVVIRCGPWCHGEVRNGGMPDWILNKEGVKARSPDPAFLDIARILYKQIFEQVKGLLWKEGGPVVGAQVDNEYGGPGEYLMELKKIAVEVGMDVPLYTRTGWPTTTTPIPFGELLPLYGAYAEGFWSREITPMPGDYWRAFTFELVRTDVEVGADMLGKREVSDDIDTAQYPYLTCELGGGMEQSYHRRVYFFPMDALAVAISKLGSGGNLPGYYMYHGGTNPIGKLSTLHESQATKYWNDVPVKSYDFQAPLGQFGQIREQYHLLRRLHLMLHDFGEQIARMTPALPDKRPQQKDDVETLRFAIRHNGDSGFLFVNNYQRLTPMPRREAVQFELGLLGGTVRIPDRETSIDADTAFVWPFNLDLGDGALLRHATAQLICKVEDESAAYFIFSKSGSTPAQFVFAQKGSTVEQALGEIRQTDSEFIVDNVKTGLAAAITLKTAGKTIQIVLLDDATSLQLWKFRFAGKDRVVVSNANLVADADQLRATSPTGKTTLHVLPAMNAISIDGVIFHSQPDGVFSRFEWMTVDRPTPRVEVDAVAPAGELRTITTGFAKVAEAPSDADFDDAAVWKIRIDDKGYDGLIRIRYVGDVARIYAGGELITDNFYNGRPFDVSLRSIPAFLRNDELELRILPLQITAPIYLLPQFQDNGKRLESRVEVQSVDLISTKTVAIAGDGN